MSAVTKIFHGPKINYDPIFPTDLSLDLAHLDVAMPGVDDAFHHTS